MDVHVNIGLGLSSSSSWLGDHHLFIEVFVRTKVWRDVTSKKKEKKIIITGLSQAKTSP
jgi:hypothetical protein